MAGHIERRKFLASAARRPRSPKILLVSASCSGGNKHARVEAIE
jgi:hypothetical protein